MLIVDINSVSLIFVTFLLKELINKKKEKTKKSVQFNKRN